MLALLAGCGQRAGQTSVTYEYPFQNPSLTFEERAADLVSRLTLDEKVGLMMDRSKAVKRLGVDEYGWWNEALHGVARFDTATVFPQAIGMAATFDDEALLRSFTAVSDEGRAKATHSRRVDGQHGKYRCVTYWTPNINIFRDPRWGRGQETYGEDPYLTSRMGVAVVKGLQGPETGKYAKAYACAKHYAVHSGPEWNRHSFDAKNIAPEDLWETYLPAFKAAVQEGDVKQVMCAYNRYEGQPCCGSDALLIQILREDWNYAHYVVSDCGAIDDFYKGGHHETHPDSASAAADAILHGTDLECGRSYRSLPTALARGLITEDQVDVSLRRLLKARFELGDFDPDSIVSWANIPMSVVNCQAHKDLALEMAHKSIVLLKNDKGMLPLSKEAKGVVVMGPNADNVTMQWGNYNGTAAHTSTMIDGVRAFLGETVPCLPTEYLLTDEKDATKAASDEAVAAYVAARMAGLPECETVLFFGGISPKLEGEEMRVNLPGFFKGDRLTIELPAVQRALVKALKDAGKQVVFINCSGSAVALTPEADICDALVQAWYPGEAGGQAVADVLFGDFNPAGRLPVTFYRDDSQLPDFEDYSMKGHTYRFFEGDPLFEFGYGLSYTTFAYSEPVYNARRHSVTVKITNTGSRDGEEVAQLYIRRLGSQERAKALRGFSRVNIPAGQTVKVTFPLDDASFAFYDEDAQNLKSLPGPYLLSVGPSSAEKNLKSIQIQR